MTDVPAYANLTDACSKIDRRHTRYQFDLEADVAWNDLGAPGLHFGKGYLECMGVNVAALATNPEAEDLFQWAFALATCEVFRVLEELILRFADSEEKSLAGTRSMTLLCEEERKHIELFERYAAHLRALRPVMAERFTACFQPSANLLGHLHEREAYPNPAAYHYLFWINTLFFEELTIFIDRCLSADEELIQPAWLSLHRVHRLEEVQHLVTDEAHLGALNLSANERYHLSKVFLFRLEEGFDRFFGLEAVARVLSEARPDLPACLTPQRSFRDLPMYSELLHSAAFRKTRAAAPYLQRLSERTPTAPPAAPRPRAEATGPDLLHTDATSLASILAKTATAQGVAPLIYVEGDAEIVESYQLLAQRAERVLAGLRAEGLQPGDPVLLLLEQPRAFLAAFWGCILGGFVPAPVGLSVAGAEQDARLSAVHERLGNPLVVVQEPLPDTPWRQRTVAELLEFEPDSAWSPGSGSDPAHIQFSSGSTGDPRGVVLSHRNVISNTAAALQHLEATADDVVVNWLPLHHDLGLSFHLTPLVLGVKQVLLSPLHFARRPMLWLQLLSRHRGTFSASPNFGFAQVLRRLRPQRLEGLDLSSVRCILDGAEPISRDLALRFAAQLAPAGFPPNAICPAYGLAEATVAVTLGAVGEPIRERVFDRDSLANRDGAQEVDTTHPRATRFVDVGRPVPGCRIRVCDESGRVLPEGVMGQIEVRGPHVTRCIWRDPEATRASLRGGWLRTGDLGLVLDGRLTITGRAKDVVFVNGRNYFATDLELLLHDLDGISPDRVAVVGSTDPKTGLERVVPFVRLRPRATSNQATTIRRVAERLADALSFHVDHVVVLPSEFFPRTTSGKIRRHRLREAFDAGEFEDYTWPVGPSTRPAPERADPREPAPGRRRNAEAIRQIWAEVLNRDPASIGLDDSFFALGGDSLMAVDVHDRLEQHSGRLLDQRILRECRTIRESAAFLDAELAGGGTQAKTTRPSPDASGSRDIAIVALGLRLPGAPTPEAFWALLASGQNAIREVPEDRWDPKQYFGDDPSVPGKTVCKVGGFLEDLRSFDPEAFGLSAREVRPVDPQQRLFLEVATEALDQVGLTTQNVGVFAGAGGNQYFNRHATDVRRITGVSAQSNLDNMVAARLSQLLGFRGPALTVNAACATSLVAVHLACQSILSGECEVAVAGGVELNLTVVPYLLFSQAGVLSQSGACRPFSELADGFVPGEGAGAVVLKELAAAQRDGDPILAVIKGSAVNNDGGGLSSLAPNPAGQRRVLERAYATAGIDPATISYIEAHGTGTPIGDPIEVRALSQVFGEAGLPTGSIGLGSAKSNVGHLFNAAGITALIKVVLSLRHQTLPAICNGDAPPKAGLFDRTPFSLVTAKRPWTPAPGAPRRAGVNAFGIGGTNCHVIVEEAPPVGDEPAPREAHLLCLSAPDARALERVAKTFAETLDENTNLGAFSASANQRSARFSHRRALTLNSVGDARAQLGSLGQGRSPTGSPRLVFVYPGPGSQFVGMGKHLLNEPAFEAALAEVDAVLTPLGLRPLAELMDHESMHRIERSQPVVFGFSYALTRWLASLGVRPDAVIGHSAGEYAAACAAGALSLEDAATLVFRRGECMAATEPGAMAAVFGPEDRVRGHLPEAVSIACVNEPSQVVISGDAAAVDAALATLEAAGIASRRLAISCAAHSQLMVSAQRRFEPILGAAVFRAPQLTFFSTARGARASTVGADYWLDHLRTPVRFADAVRCALGAGYRNFLEVGASAALSHCITQIHGVARDLSRIEAVPLLRRSLPGWAPTLEGLGRLFEAGVPLRLDRLAGARRRRGLQLPAYPYSRRELWLEPPPLQAPLSSRSAFRLRAPQEVGLDLDGWPAIRDHRVHRTAIAPAALLFDRMLSELAAGDPACALTDALIQRPLALEPGESRTLRMRQIKDDEDEVTILESRRDEGESPWEEHLRARFEPMRRTIDWKEPGRDMAAIRARCSEEVLPEALYARLAAGGLTYGPSMRTVTSIWRSQGEVLAQLCIPAASDPHGGAPHRLHPGLVDGAMQSIAALTLDADTSGGAATFLGFAVRRVAVQAQVERDCLAHIRLRSELRPDSEAIRCDVALLDETGRLLASFEQVALKRFHGGEEPSYPSEEGPALPSGSARFYSVGWAPAKPAAGGATPGSVLILGARSGLQAALARQIEAAGGVALPLPIPHGPAEWVAALAPLTRASAGSASTKSIVCVAPSLIELGDLTGALARSGTNDLGGLLVVSEDPSVFGFLRAAAAEYPGWGCRGLRLEPGEANAPETSATVLAELTAPATRFLLRLVDGELCVPTLDRLAPPTGEPALRPRGVYWITGGLGGLGLAVAEVLATRVGARLLLTGRRAQADPRTLSRLEVAGGEVLYVSADVTDAVAMRRAHDAARRRWGGIHGVVHCAGVLRDARLADRTPEQAHAVVAPKVEGARVLTEVTTADDLDFAVFFSSLSALYGVAGQADYAAGNASLDALATTLRRGRARVLSIAWGPWRDVGMVSDDRYQRDLAAQGLRPLSPRAGCRAFLRALALDPALHHVAIVDVDGEREAALLGRFNRSLSAGPALPTFDGSEDADLRGFLRAAVAEHLRCDPERVDPNTPLQRLGVDSLMAVNLVRLIERRYGLTLYPTLLFEFQTLKQLADHLEATEDLDRGSRGSPEPAVLVTPAVDAGGVRAFRVTEGRLELCSIAPRDPGPDEVEIDVSAVGVNFIDLLATVGMHPVLGEAIEVPGHEVAGVVRRVGSNVDRLRVGDRVMSLVPQGAYAARVVAPSASTVPVPDGLTDVEAAAVLITGLTAVACVEIKGRVAWGERVLIQAAAGGTGLACVQLALHHGAEVFGTAGAPAKLSLLKDMGVAHPIDYRSEPFEDAIKKLTEGDGVDVIVDSLSGDAIQRGLSILRSGGRFIEIGAAGVVEVPPVDPKQLFLANQDFSTVNVARLEASPAQLRLHFDRLEQLLREGVLRPHVGSTLPFAEAPEAHRLMRSRENIGKVVLVF
jgi:acyl transferase domain-containing protein/acyl-CoA synthetase (AMP-forming)/AMP-acid ligase II/NADPH:quinone reductase-like Zn-dependent oxidoreductase/acyl carrier protein